MQHGGTFEVLGPVLQICLIDLLLSGDNAVLIALACRSLPPRLWRRAVLFGTLAAIVLRTALTALAALVLNLPYLKLAGAALLVAIAINLLAEDAPPRPVPDAQQEHDMWKAVTTIIVADTIMSLDNVLAVAAASQGSFLLLAFGLLLSIPILIFGSVMVTRLLDRYPIAIPAGSALLGWVAGSTAVSDPAVAPWLDSQSIGLVAAAPLLAAVYVVIQGRIARRAATRDPAPAASWAGQMLASVGFRGKGHSVLAATALVAWVLSGIYRVQPGELGVVLRFGKPVETQGPGLHYHLPYPIDTVLLPGATRAHHPAASLRAACIRRTTASNITWASRPSESKRRASAPV